MSFKLAPEPRLTQREAQPRGGPPRSQRPGLRSRALSRFACASTSATNTAVIMDVDAVLYDMHIDGHRVAFNKAFAESGVCSTKWSPADYDMIMRAGDGTGTGLVRTWFRCTGWPTEFKTDDAKTNYAEFIYARKRDLFAQMVAKDEIKLRDGAERFIREAVAGGVKLALLNYTTSVPEDGVAEMLKRQVPNLPAMMINLPDREVIGQELKLESLEDVLRLKMDDIKLAEARAVRLSMASTDDVLIDANLMLGSLARAPQGKWLQAVISLMGSDADHTALVAGSIRVLKAGQQIGLACAVVPSKVASTGYFPGATKYFGFGAGGGVTLPKIKSLVEKHAATAEDRKSRAKEPERWHVAESEIDDLDAMEN